MGYCAFSFLLPWFRSRWGRGTLCTLASKPRPRSQLHSQSAEHNPPHGPGLPGAIKLPQRWSLLLWALVCGPFLFFLYMRSCWRWRADPWTGSTPTLPLCHTPAWHRQFFTRFCVAFTLHFLCLNTAPHAPIPTKLPYPPTTPPPAPTRAPFIGIISQINVLASCSTF